MGLVGKKLHQMVPKYVTVLIHAYYIIVWAR